MRLGLYTVREWEGEVESRVTHCSHRDRLISHYPRRNGGCMTAHASCCDGIVAMASHVTNSASHKGDRSRTRWLGQEGPLLAGGKHPRVPLRHPRPTSHVADASSRSCRQGTHTYLTCPRAYKGSIPRVVRGICTRLFVSRIRVGCEPGTPMDQDNILHLEWRGLPTQGTKVWNHLGEYEGRGEETERQDRRQSALASARPISWQGCPGLLPCLETSIAPSCPSTSSAMAAH